MDYFNELLESYNQLKKRSFRLKYISEAEEAAKKKEEEDEEDPKQYEALIAQIQQAAGTPLPAQEGGVGGALPRNWEEAKEAARGVGFPNQTGDGGGGQIYVYHQEGTTAGAIIGHIEGPKGTGGGILDAQGVPKFTREGVTVWKALTGGQSDDARQQGDIVNNEQLRQELFGSLFKDEGFENATALVMLLHGNLDALKDICKQNLSPAFSELCKMGDQAKAGLIGGNVKGGLEPQFANAFAVSMDEETGDFTQTEATELDPEVMEGALQSHQELLKAFENQTIDCNAINDRAAISGDRLVLFHQASNKTEGIAISKSQIQESILNGLKEKGCELDTLQVSNSELTQNRINEIMGRFNEFVVGSVISMINAVKAGDASLLKKSTRRFLLEAKRQVAALTKVIENKKYPWDPEATEVASLRELVSQAQQGVRDRGISLQSLSIVETVEGLLEFFENVKKLKGLILNIFHKNLKLLQDVDADGTLSMGTSQRAAMKTDMALFFREDPGWDTGATGARGGARERAVSAARKLGFMRPEDAPVELTVSKLLEMIEAKSPERKKAKNREAALEKLAELGLTEDSTESFWIVNTASKFTVKKGEDIKQGEGGLKKTLQTAQGYFPKDGKEPVDTSAYFKNRKANLQFTDDDIAAASSFGAEAERRFDLLSGITDSKTVWTVNGATVVNSKEAAKAISKMLLGHFPVNNIPKPFRDVIITKSPAGKTEQADMSDPAVQRSLREVCERVALSYMLNQGLNPEKTKGETDAQFEKRIKNDKYKAEMYILSTAAQLCQNDGEMVQMVVENTGEVYSFDQNEILRLMGQAKTDGKIKITKKAQGRGEFTVKISFPGPKGEELSCVLRMERGGKSPTWHMYTGQEDLRSLNPNQPKREEPKAENAGIFYEFLKGQQRLLEQLLTPSTASHNSLG